MNENDIMCHAIELAERARGETGTNPLVGAVIVKNNRVIGEGYHRYYGGDHAEVDAIKHASESLEGSEVYVSLEPCSHYGKTPPCTRALIDAKVRRVHAAMVDPNPLVSGQGIAGLREAGIEVKVGLCEAEARRLNEAYIKYITTGLPFVTLKIAQTLDGRIADRQGNSKWITSDESRRRVHLLRSQSGAVLVGARTARIDDPLLTSHGVRERNPLRLILSRHGLEKDDLHLIKDNADRKTVIVTGKDAASDEVVKVDANGLTTWRLQAGNSGCVDLTELMRYLGSEKVVNLLVEGGTEIFSAFIDRRLVDKFIFVVAPKLLGDGAGAYRCDGRNITDTLNLRIDRSYQMGGDLWIEAYPEQ